MASSCSPWPPSPFLLLHNNTVCGLGHGRRHQLVSARRMDDAPYVASWVGSEPAVLVAPVVALVEGRAASHGEGEGGFEGFARVGSWGACCCASGVACSAPLSVVSAFALLIGSLFCVLLCAPVLNFWLVPAEQPLVSEGGAVGRWFSCSFRSRCCSLLCASGFEKHFAWTALGVCFLRPSVVGCTPHPAWAPFLSCILVWCCLFSSVVAPEVRCALRPPVSVLPTQARVVVCSSHPHPHLS